MATVPKGMTIYTKGKTYKSGKYCPENLIPNKNKKNVNSFSKPEIKKDEEK